MDIDTAKATLKLLDDFLKKVVPICLGQPCATKEGSYLDLCPFYMGDRTTYTIENDTDGIIPPKVIIQGSGSIPNPAYYDPRVNPELRPDKITSIENKCLLHIILRVINSDPELTMPQKLEVDPYGLDFRRMKIRMERDGFVKHMCESYQRRDRKQKYIEERSENKGGIKKDVAPKDIWDSE